MSKLTLVFSLSLLCHFTSPMPTTTINPPLCAATSVDYLPFRYRCYCHVLTVRYLLAAYPGIQQMVLCLCSSYPPFAMSCPFANSLNCAVVACYDAFISLSMLYNHTAIFPSLARSAHVASLGTQTASRRAVRSSPSRTASVNTVMIWEHILDGKAVRAPTKCLRKCL